MFSLSVTKVNHKVLMGSPTMMLAVSVLGTLKKYPAKAIECELVFIDHRENGFVFRDDCLGALVLKERLPRYYAAIVELIRIEALEEYRLIKDMIS